jgi:hypothetical protein
MEVAMATVPGPNPDKPLPRPSAPAEEPPEPVEEPDHVGPDRSDDPGWLPKPYDPDREYEEPGVPIGL